MHKVAEATHSLAQITSDPQGWGLHAVSASGHLASQALLILPGGHWGLGVTMGKSAGDQEAVYFTPHFRQSC